MYLYMYIYIYIYIYICVCVYLNVYMYMFLGSLIPWVDKVVEDGQTKQDLKVLLSYIPGFRVQGAGFAVQGARCRVQGARFRVQGSTRGGADPVDRQERRGGADQGGAQGIVCIYSNLWICMCMCVCICMCI